MAENNQIPMRWLLASPAPPSLSAIGETIERRWFEGGIYTVEKRESLVAWPCLDLS